MCTAWQVLQTLDIGINEAFSIGVVGAPISRGRRKTTEVEISFDEQGIVNSIEERRPPQ